MDNQNAIKIFEEYQKNHGFLKKTGTTGNTVEDIKSNHNERERAVETLNALDALDVMKYSIKPKDEGRTFSFPSITLDPGEGVEVTIRKINNEIINNPEQNIRQNLGKYHIIGEKDLNAGEEARMNPIHNQYRIMMRLLNIGGSTFLTAAVTFLFFAVSNIILPRNDSMFGFFLCLIVGLIFITDKMYRRTINNDTTQRSS